MLAIEKQQTLESVVIYGDTELTHKFYVVPEQPRFRLDDNGLPVFRFLKYRVPIDRGNGKKGGGFAFFDVEFTVPEAKLVKIKEALQGQVNRLYANNPTKAPEVVLGNITYTQAKAGLNLQSLTGELIQRVVNPGRPSMYGKNITSFSVEFSPEGATLFEQALQGKGGVAQVSYDLGFTAALPDVSAHVWFRASNFMSFYKQIDEQWSAWGEDSRYEKVSEYFHKMQIGGTELDFRAVSQDPETDRKLKDKIQDWADRTLQDAVQRMVVGEIDPVKANEITKPDGFENMTYSELRTRVADFDQWYRQRQAITWTMAPQGTLPNITTLLGKDGQPLKWQDYSAVVDLDDPFFKTLNVAVQVNADFKDLPIYSVDAHLSYTQGTTHRVEDFSFKTPDDVFKFASYIENNTYKYKYHYTVNYKGAAQTFKSPEVETDAKMLTINVDDLGVLSVDVLPGDLNFAQVAQAQVTLQYEDVTHGVNLIEASFTLTKDQREHRLQKLILQPRRNPIKYRVKYFMQDGREFQVDWRTTSAKQIFINDPFSATKSMGVRASGDLERRVDTIFVDLKYEDPQNKFIQTQSVALNKANPFFDWSFPVIDEGTGKVTYAGIIKYRDNHEENIPITAADMATFMVGPKVAGFVKVDVVPDLIDFSAVKLARVSLRYQDPAHGIDEAKDFFFKNGTASMQNWIVEMSDPLRKDYEWFATFYMNNATQRKTPPTKTREPSIVVELPVA